MGTENTLLHRRRNRLLVSELARNLGRRLRYLRAQSGMTQEELSIRAAPMGRAYLSKLECGRVLPRYCTLVRLAIGLGVDPGELVRGNAATADDRNNDAMNVPQ